MRRIALAAFIVATFAIMSTGCGDKTVTTEATTTATKEAVTEATTEEVTTEAATEADTASDSEAAAELPKYEYNGVDTIEKAVYEYMLTKAADYPEGAVAIPAGTIIDVDDKDPEDVKVLGDFEIYIYDLEGDTLKTKAGGSYPGMMHLKKNDDETYTVTSFDEVESGAGFDDSVKEIFGDKADAYFTATSDMEQRNTTRGTLIAEYVAANGLAITKYQDEGWDPVTISAVDPADNAIVYMGGLYSHDGKSDMNLALFKSSGVPVAIVQIGDKIWYGEMTTEEATLDDGREYISLKVEDKTFGYHFYEDGTGFLIDDAGEVHDSLALDESVANDMKAMTE